nr:MAG TPA: hypothetical protein [Caudoviricetes sp.]
MPIEVIIMVIGMGLAKRLLPRKISFLFMQKQL